MKKNLIALAVAAAALPFAAVADVTVSGGLQAQLVSVGGDGAATPTGLYASDGGEFGSENGGSFGFIKFSASEDLGNGLTALAMWNGVANVGDSNAAGGISGRDAYVGLSGSFGTVLAGTLATPYKSSTVSWDPFVTTFMQARGNFGMSDAQNGYASNALAYANTFGAVKLVAAMVLDESVDPTDGTKAAGKHAMAFSLNVPFGPVEVALAMVNADEFTNIGNLGLGATASALGNNTLDTLTATKLGAKYSAGDLTIAAQTEMLTLEDATAGVTTLDMDVNYMYLTGSYTVGANTFSAAFGNQTWKPAGGTETTDTYAALGMKHAFSKKVSAHLGYRASSVDTTPSNDETMVGAGLVVKF